MGKKGLLKHFIVKVILVLIAFFSLIKVDAANFAYNAFDWDKFYEENVGYWTDYCKTQGGDISLDDCLEITLSGKKEYYITLYKMLAKYEKKGYKLDDNILLATTFYYLTPDSFSDLPEEYLRDYMDGSAYALDGDIDTYDVDTDLTEEYYTHEKDSLKMLTKHMFSYPASCTGVVSSTSIDSNGKKYCEQGTLNGDNCVDTIDTYRLNYTEYLIEKWGWLLKFFGFTPKARQDCESKGGTYIPASGKKQIDYEKYWEFLEESEYFDNKVHLTSKYSKVLELSNHILMKELSKDEREQYEDELIKIRERIVREIQSILKGYGKFAETPDSFFTTSSFSGSAWWPIGSDVTTEVDGVIFAKETPVSVNIKSKFGLREHPITGEEKQHSGIDIGGVSEGVTNVIAVKDGVVVYPTEGADTNCPSSTSMDSCGGGYGNYVVIQHNDGTYSLYAHLYAGSITVSANDSVKQGQVIGKVGSSGNSTGPHLHFEIRQGSNSSTSAVDPLNFISAENPRSICTTCGNVAGDFITFLHSWENAGGAPERNGNYVVHDDGAHIPTVGYGVALKYNVDRFKSYGINVQGMTFGDEIPKDIVDAVEMEEINEALNNIRNLLAKNGISLLDYQIEALVSRYYNCGNVNSFPQNYLKYGDTDALYNNYMNKPVTGIGVGYLPGLERRRKAEWNLFHNHIYELNA